MKDTLRNGAAAEQPVADRQQTDAPAFIGRRHEISLVRRILAKTRLLTLTGAGGVGKTRLAQRVGEIVPHRYRDGVRLVELATIDDEDLLAPAVAASLGIRDTTPDLVALLIEHLADKQLLLVLDNCEHLRGACARLVHRLLRGTSRLQILATSRQSLGVYGEQVLPVPSLPIPQPGDSTHDIARSDAVRLFAKRAATIRPGFLIDAANAQAVARLARRLDGIPLAIELAAVRLRTTSVEDLVNELDERLEVAAEVGPGTPARHQTLRATMEWSFGLCSSGERRLWERLSMFPGGVDLETAEAVCPGQGLAREDVLDLMAGLGTSPSCAERSSAALESAAACWRPSARTAANSCPPRTRRRCASATSITIAGWRRDCAWTRWIPARSITSGRSSLSFPTCGSLSISASAGQRTPPPAWRSPLRCGPTGSSRVLSVRAGTG
ncbi:AAA family ATPase [Nonomuraea sp. NPDC049784]|uniref:ATP-binding protein n=1 Tax=Nonomuraea sp. NPDC049784 TaxID=3154361 RepID=UPI0033E5AC3E